MYNQQIAIQLIKSLTGQANVLTIPRAFVDYTGSLDGALFLSQVLYWSDKGGSKDGWFYKTYAEWQEEICLSEYEVRKVAKKLKKLGILETKVKKAHGSPTVHYRLDFDKFSVSFLEFLQERNQRKLGNESEETQGTITETTAKTTTEREEEPNDYLADVLASQAGNGREGVADPSKDHELWLQYNKQFPAIYHKRTGEHPSGSQRDAILELAQQPNADPAFWDDVVYNWVLMGWRPKNIKGMIDCYTRREIPGSDRERGAKAEVVERDDGKRIKVVK